MAPLARTPLPHATRFRAMYTSTSKQFNCPRLNNLIRLNDGVDNLMSLSDVVHVAFFMHGYSSN